MTAANSSAISRWNFAAAVAAWVAPGVGHLLLGQRKRGLILLVSIGSLWLAGLMMGGITVIDHKAHPAWFLGQMLVGPSLAADYYHQHLRSVDPGNLVPGESPAFEPSFARVNEQGVLYTALAGLLNLLAVLDVVYRDPADPRYRQAQQQENAP